MKPDAIEFLNSDERANYSNSRIDESVGDLENAMRKGIGILESIEKRKENEKLE